ncbi:transcriptional repressor general negative regulator of transcription subunit 4 [Mortierella sp. AD094]|nr:transcriptional repressor general negative regulator of transcription subunit 4 [Mortierella sp. AD094]
MYSEEEDFDCPLCMEELDISDRNFRPCPCGYQICRFCWHHIKEDLSGRCPACRRVYSEETVEFTPISADELAMIKNEKKAKEREKKEIEAMNRKHLANMRVVQKSLVYVIGLPPKLANDEHTLRQHEYFGQYGKISKVVINRRNAPMPAAGSSPGVPSVGVYITYARKEDAAKAIAAIDGSIWDGKILRASYGTTKYCTYYLRGMNCQNPNCMYLHEPGEDADSYTKEDLAVGKHHLQEHIVPYDPSIHKPAVLGRPTLPTQSSSSSLTPRPKHATVTSYHANTSSLSDWPAPGEKSNSEDKDRDKDKDDEGSALPATASWAKIGSNPSTPILMNSKPLSRRTTTEPPPLHAKGSTSSIITGVVVNSGKQKDPAFVDSPALDYSPTPAEALAIEAAAKQQMVQEQRLLQEQQRKILKKQQKQQEETDQQAELLSQKLKKQKQLEQEQDQQELQKQKQLQEMEQRLQQTQKEKEQQRIDQKEKEVRDKEKLAQEAREKKEMEEKRQKVEELERREMESRDLEERRRKQMDSMFVTTPTLSLGSFSFNPDASLATQPSAFGNGGGLMPLGSETPGAFGLDSFSAFSNLPVTPGHYTGSFNPFSLDDEPLMRRPAAPPSRSFLDDTDFDPITGRSRQVGPPIPGKPRQTSRFGFATDSQYGDSFSNDRYSTPQAMQDGFRALFPNVNVSFSNLNGSLSAQQQQQFHQQQQQQQQQQQYPTSPLFHRQESMQTSGWETSDKQDLQMLQRNMGQLSMDPMPTTPSSRMAEYHQQLQMQQHSQRSGPPGITRNTLTPSMVKSPPPGLESIARSDISNWTGLQLQQRQQQQQLQQQLQQQHQSSRMNDWSSENSMNYINNAGSANQSNNQDIFGAFLKAAAASPQSQSANLSSGNQGNHGTMTFQDPAIMSARISAASKASLVEALQNPPSGSNLTGYRMSPSQDGLRSLGNDTMSGRAGEVDRTGDAQLQQRQQPTRQSTPESPSSLQNFPLGSKRKEIKSVKGVLNSGMNAPLNGGSRSRPPSTPGSPLVEPRVQLFGQQQQQPTSFGAGEANMMTGMTSVTARSAKVKSDLLMGLNSPSFRSDRFSAAAMKDSNEAGHDQDNSTKMNGLYGSTGGQYNMNGYGQPSVSANGPSGTAVSGPPPGLGMPTGSGNNSPYLMSSLLGNQENGLNRSYLSNNKPLDVASMMNALDFFGPGQASSLMMSPSWSTANGSNVNGSQHMGAYNDQGGNDIHDNSNGSNDSAKGNGNDSNNTNDTNSTSATARSVEDLELQVINAKMETQMLENQLNAVIKRNRRKLYA